MIGAKVFAIMETTLGLLALAWPLAWGTGWTYAMASAGAVCVLAAVAAHWRPGPVLAVAAAITACAFSRAGTFVLAAEGLLILGYLLAVHAPIGLARADSWLRQQVFAAVAGLVASGAVLAALALHQVSSAALTAAGLGAAAVAYLVALPLRRHAGRGSDVDVQ
jgi:multisubunit Na+/H+ antiporter MnhG subunit